MYLCMFMWVLNDSPKAKEALSVGTKISLSEYGFKSAAFQPGSRFSASHFPLGQL